MITVSNTGNSSKAKWFWLKTAIRSPGVISKLPRVLSISPESTVTLTLCSLSIFLTKFGNDYDTDSIYVDKDTPANIINEIIRRITICMEQISNSDSEFDIQLFNVCKLLLQINLFN